MKLYSSIFVTTVIVILFSCNSKTKSGEQGVTKKYSSPCGCVLSDEEMITLCPVDALGDSILICKVGTNSVIGSGRPPMNWTEFIKSEYSGGEGILVNCKTGDTLFPGLYNRVISYRNKSLIVDERIPFDVYDKQKSAWVNIDIPVRRNIVYAFKGEIRISKDSFILKPPFQDKKVFAAISYEYEKEEQSTTHYMISNLPGRLLTCAMNGDTVSANRLMNFQNRFSEYFSQNEVTKKILERNQRLYVAYSDYLAKGGNREYIDLSKFVYFKNGIPGKK